MYLDHDSCYFRNNKIIYIIQLTPLFKFNISYFRYESVKSIVIIICCDNRFIWLFSNKINWIGDTHLNYHLIGITIKFINPCFWYKNMKLLITDMLSQWLISLWLFWLSNKITRIFPNCYSIDSAGHT